MGRVIKIVIIPLKCRFVRVTLSAKNQARAIDMIVAVAAAFMEFKRESLNLGILKTALTSEPAIFTSMMTKGQITVTNIKSAIRSFTIVERRMAAV